MSVNFRKRQFMIALPTGIDNLRPNGDLEACTLDCLLDEDGNIITSTELDFYCDKRLLGYIKDDNIIDLILFELYNIRPINKNKNNL